MLKVLVVFLAAWLVGEYAKEAPVTPALFVVVPAKDGHIGKIVVTRGDETRVIDTAFGAQRVRADGAVEAAKLSQEEVRAAFGATLDALPGRPASFLLYFLEGKDELTAESRIELDKVFAELRLRPLPDIVVIGHTDTVGSLARNDALSLARAERVREMLVGLGIPPAQVQVAGRGEREPLVPTEDEVAEPRNRRVEISVR